MIKICFVAFLVFNQAFAIPENFGFYRRAFTAEQMTTITKYVTACAKENPNPENQYCHVKCLYEKMGIIKNGKFNPDAVLSVLPVYKEGTKEYLGAKKVVNNCRDKLSAKKYDSCDLAKAISDCILSESMAAGLN